MIKKILIFVLIVFTIYSCEKEELAPIREAPVYIKGTLLGSNNKPLIKSSIHAYMYGIKKDETLKAVESDGRFSLPFKDVEYFELEFSGVNHKVFYFEMFNFGGNKDIELKIRLEPNMLFEQFEELKVIGNFNSFSFDTGYVKMKEMPDGKFVANVPNKHDTLFYQILGAAPGPRSINGTMSMGYVYDGAGDYRSYLISKDSIINIVFDPEKIDMPYRKPMISSPNPKIEHYINVISKLDSINNLAMDIYQKTLNVKKYYQFLFDNIKNLTETEKDERTKLMLSKYYLEYAYYAKAKINKDIIRNFLYKIGKKSSYWEKDISFVIPALNFIGDNVFKSDFFNFLIYKHNSTVVRQKALYEIIEYAFSKKDTLNGLKYYHELVNKYPNSNYTKIIKKEYSPDRKVVVGKYLPYFRIINYDRPNSYITPETLKGKYTLIDLWATWCNPCVSEMPNLHKIFKKFRRKKFQILSISLDRSKNDVKSFRKGKWKMPWLHSFSKGVWKSDMVDFFEVTGIPKGILINPDGKILVIGDSLRGENLAITLKKYLK